MIDSFLLSQCVSLIKEFSERTIYINYAKIFFQVYDMYGEEGLKGGMGGGGGGAPHEHFNPGGGNSYTYSYHGDPRATFAEFFGTSNPFDIFFGGGGGGVPGGQGQPGGGVPGFGVPGGVGGVPGMEGMDIDLDSLLGGMGRGTQRSHTFHSGGMH